jgi:hypothetical protein
MLLSTAKKSSPPLDYFLKICRPRYQFGVPLWSLKNCVYQIKPFVGEFMDAGPGVRVSNFKVGFRITKFSCIHETHSRIRFQCTKEDSGQNESKSMYIVEALVDGGSIYY